MTTEQRHARRLPPEERKQQILDRAVTLAESVGYRMITAAQVAEACGLSGHGLIGHYFGTVDGLRKAVFRRAIETENVEIIAQGLVTKDLRVRAIPADLKTRALSYLAQE